MNTASIPQLIKAIALLETSIKLHKIYYTSCNKKKDLINAGLHFRTIIKAFNEVALLYMRIRTLKLSGDTDDITTAQALSLLGIDYTVKNSAFYINP